MQCRLCAHMFAFTGLWTPMPLRFASCTLLGNSTTAEAAKMQRDTPPLAADKPVPQCRSMHTQRMYFWYAPTWIPSTPHHHSCCTAPSSHTATAACCAATTFHPRYRYTHVFHPLPAGSVSATVRSTSTSPIIL
jgi:hypothetical protein